MLNIKTIKFIKDFSYTLTSSLISMLIASLVVLVVPKVVGVKEYGYWQLYIFYATYVGFMHFGWNDGIYLRYGGQQYRELDKRLFFSQFYMLFFLQIIITIIILTFSIIFIKDSNKLFICFAVSTNMLFMNLRTMILFILQATKKIKEYAFLTIIDRIIYIFILTTFLLLGIRSFKLLIGVDLIGIFISLSFGMIICKDLVFQKISSFYLSFKEAIENVRVGIKLMIANIAGMLIIGIVRYGIERSWDVTTFGKVALVLNISNLMMVFINAIGIVMYPILRRADAKNLTMIYLTIRNFLMVLLFGILILYFPLKYIFLIWYSKYTEALTYLAILFPIVIFEGKMALLINTYCKTLRKENLILGVNIISVIVSIIFTIFSTLLIGNLDLAVFSILFLLALRSVLAEIFLSRILNVSMFKELFLDLSLTIIFIIIAGSINSGIIFLLYVFIYIIYLIIKRRDIFCSIQNLKFLMRSNVDD